MGFIKAFISKLGRPSRRFAVGTLVAVGLVAGVLVTSAFTVAVDSTNTTEFCISCHSMKDVPYQEYTASGHLKNRSGVSAGCPDCHVPKSFWPKMRAKVMAAKDVWHEMLGTIDSEEKFKERRLQMAKRVWQGMKQSDSATCRSCHAWGSMNYEAQALRARRQHQAAQEQGETCIDCHKGITHTEPVPESDGTENADFNLAF